MLVYAHRVFFFNDTATTEIYTLSLHDALPIFLANQFGLSNIGEKIQEIVGGLREMVDRALDWLIDRAVSGVQRSEEHTSELQSRQYLVCRLLLEKKNKNS